MHLTKKVSVKECPNTTSLKTPILEHESLNKFQLRNPSLGTAAT